MTQTPVVPAVAGEARAEPRLSPQGRGPALAGHDGKRTVRLDADDLVFLLLLGLSLIPLWAFTYFGSQDGPAHVYNAAVIAEYARPDRSVLREFYYLKLQLEPNLLGHLVLAGLITFVSPLLAEKLLLTSYVVLFVFSVRYAMRAMNARSPHVGLLAFPLVYNYALYMGFYNYALGLPLFLLVVGYWYRNRDSFTVPRAVVFAALLFVLYLAHLLTLGMALLSIAILGMGLTVVEMADPQTRGKRVLSSVWPALRTRALVPIIAALPVLYLTIDYLGRSPGSRSALPDPGEVLFRVAFLLGYGGVVSLSGWEIPVVGILSGVLIGTSIVCLRAKVTGREPWQRGDLLLGVLGGITAFYLFVPEQMAGGWYVWPRMGVLIFLSWLLWLSTQSHLPSAPALRLTAVVLTVGLLFVRLPVQSELNSQLSDFLAAAPHVEENSTLVSLDFSHALPAGGDDTALMVKPRLHAAGYVAAQRGAVLINNYQGVYPLFPVQFRPQLSPAGHIRPQDVPADESLVDLDAITSRIGRPIDHVLLWHVEENQRDMPAVRALFSSLDRGYRLSHGPAGESRLRLYRSRPHPVIHETHPSARGHSTAPPEVPGR